MIEVPLELQKEIKKTDTLVLFGSYARNEIREDSDIDLLAITKYKKSKNKLSYDKYNLNFYSFDYLIKLANEGSLFIRHLISESILITGEKDIVERLAYHYSTSSSHSLKLKQLIFSAKFLDVDMDTYKNYPKKFNQLAFFILRTLIYTITHELGYNSFSLIEISRYLNKPEILELHNLKHNKGEETLFFLKCYHLIEKLTENKIQNEYLTYDALLLESQNVGELPFWLGLRLYSDTTTSYIYDF